MSVAPDGSPIELYLALPGAEDATLIHEAIPASAPLLELGCGVGRVSRHLVELGHPVTGVDNSPAMLEQCARRVPGVELVLGDIASLDLGRTWPVVVLGSHMINSQEGPAFLRSGARHLDRGGLLLVERHAPGWIDSAEPLAAERHDVSLRMTDIVHVGRGLLSATMQYTVAGRTYRQPFLAHEVHDERLSTLATDAGLKVVRTLTSDGAWVVLERT